MKQDGDGRCCNCVELCRGFVVLPIVEVAQQPKMTAVTVLVPSVKVDQMIKVRQSADLIVDRWTET